MSSKLIAGNATNGSSLSADTTGILEIQTGSTPTTAITVDASQNVGIGTTSPSGKLHTVSANNTDTTVIGSFDANNQTQRIQIGFQSIAQYSAADPIRFLTGGLGGSERMRIDSGGNLLVNTTTLNSGKVNIVASGASQPCMILNDSDATSASQGILSIRRNGSAVGLISTTNTNTTYATSSDYRLKENIAPMTGALATVSALKPVTYKWKSTGEESQGFIAHELQAVVPDCVTGEKDAVDAEGKPVYQGIDTSFLVATLTASIQELKAIVDAQAVEIQALKGVA